VPDDFKALVNASGLSPKQAGSFFGGSNRSGQRWAANGPPPGVAMLLHLMAFLDMPAEELEFVLCQRTGAPRSKIKRRDGRDRFLCRPSSRRGAIPTRSDLVAGDSDRLRKAQEIRCSASRTRDGKRYPARPQRWSQS
jgi:hypothetical protein